VYLPEFFLIIPGIKKTNLLELALIFTGRTDTVSISTVHALRIHKTELRKI